MSSHYNEERDISKQANWLETYRINPICLGQLCEKFPALQNSWNAFKLIYDLCKNNDENE